MDLTQILRNWPLCKAALERTYPQFSFPDMPPASDDLLLAFEGLAVMHDLTCAELVETLHDACLTTPEPAEGQAAA